MIIKNRNAAEVRPAAAGMCPAVKVIDINQSFPGLGNRSLKIMCSMWNIPHVLLLMEAVLPFFCESQTMYPGVGIYERYSDGF